MIALQRYAKTQTLTASRERLMLSLFEAVTTNVSRAIELMEAGQPRKAVPLLTKSSRIVLHLARTLNPNVEGSRELCETLSKLYLFVALRLTAAAAKLDVKLAREAQQTFKPIADGFVAAVAQITADQAQLARSA